MDRPTGFLWMGSVVFLVVLGMGVCGAPTLAGPLNPPPSAVTDIGGSPLSTTITSPVWSPLPANERFSSLLAMNGLGKLDNETGLVWESSPDDTPLQWEQAPLFQPLDARYYCATLVKGGRMGWRLPSLFELTSLVDPSNSNPALPTGHGFQNVESSNYWSATTSADIPTDAWVVNLGTGSVNTSNKSNKNSVWCVRGGMNADVY